MLGLSTKKAGVILEGNSKDKAKGSRIAIVVSKFHEFVTQRLLDAALEELTACGVKKNDIVVAWVPGAFEIPLVAQTLVAKKNIDGVICLGAVVRGETKHYDLVAENAARGIAQVSLASGKPVIFEVLATDTMELAYKRSEEKGINKGRDAAHAVLEMLDLLSQTDKIK
ncbi:MAG: 6,7-dimethyl-8-ribityllumazine synthase [Candidatus Omnitrophica bacterium]|nr:6,7-dimethyl-8-ribityllumazine synthase [Candidatus Omnitrophota bacterium]